MCFWKIPVLVAEFIRFPVCSLQDYSEPLVDLIFCNSAIVSFFFFLAGSFMTLPGLADLQR